MRCWEDGVGQRATLLEILSFIFEISDIEIMSRASLEIITFNHLNIIFGYSVMNRKVAIVVLGVYLWSNV